MKESSLLPISSPILHDIIKAYLTYDFKDIFLFCGTLPPVKRSRVFLPNTPHRLIEARQEWFLGGMRYPCDCVWVFQSTNAPGIAGSFFIVHEIKTGKYDIEEEMKKHYIHHNHVQFWMWSYKQFHEENIKPKGVFLKQLNLELLLPYIKKNTLKLMGEIYG